MGMYAMHGETASTIQDNIPVERAMCIREMLDEIQDALIKTIMQEEAANKVLTGAEASIPDIHKASDMYEHVLVLRELSLMASCSAARLEGALHRT